MMTKMRKKTLALFLALGSALSAAPVSNSENVAARLSARELGETPMLSDLQEMCDRIGGRPTGSPSCERAIDWAVAKLKAAGLSVRTESFSIPTRWLGGSASARSLSPEEFPLRVVATPYAPGTPGGKAIEARLLDAGEGTEADFARLVLNLGFERVDALLVRIKKTLGSVAAGA